MLGAGVTVFFSPIMQTFGGHPEPFGYFANFVSTIRDLLYRFNFVFFRIAFAVYIKYLIIL
jgi:hypothetical protein